MKVLSLNEVENIVAKEKIAHYEQILLLHHCFQKSPAAKTPESAYMWEKVKETRFGVG